MYMGLNHEDALECFDFEKSYSAPLPPRVVYHDDTILYQSLIGPEITDSFKVRMINLYGGEFLLDKKAGIYVVLEGEGEINGGDYSQKIKRGDYFLLPACAVDKYLMTGNLKVAECYT